MTNSRNPIAVGLVVLLALAGALYLLAQRGGSDDDTGGGTLSSADRQALDAPPVERGADATGPDPSVDLRDPEAVASAYVAAAYSLRDSDAGHTNRRAVPYAAPATAPATVGTLVVSAPPSGTHTVATVTGVEQVSGEETDTRRGYVVRYRSELDPPGRATPATGTRYLLLVRQIDGRWLVAGDRVAGDRVAGDRVDDQVDGQVGEP
ncbi:MAG TPA: hypothetical protein VL595_09960 [Pseudonocardia sp.]|nr:hypothetical protein [Pseudonocardia sp.]